MPKKIFHLDASAPVLTSTRKALEFWGYDVTSESSGLRGYGWIMDPQIRLDCDAAIIDYDVRPDSFEHEDGLIDGVDLIKLMKERYPEMPIISTTARRAQRSAEDMAEFHLRKPFYLQELKDTLNDCFGEQ